MGVTYNNRIVTDGLVLCCDLASKRTYSGSGTEWFELTTGGSGIVANSPTYNNDHFSFDGTDDYMLTQIKSVTDTGYDGLTRDAPYYYPKMRSQFTVDFVCRPYDTITIKSEGNSGYPGINGQKYIFGTPFNAENITNSNAAPCISIGTNAIQIFGHSHVYMPCYLSYQASLATINYYSIRFSGSAINLFINSVNVRNTTQVNRTLTCSFFNFGHGNGYYDGVNADFYLTRLYDRSLSDEEIRQNYLSTKERYA